MRTEHGNHVQHNIKRIISLLDKFLKILVAFCWLVLVQQLHYIFHCNISERTSPIIQTITQTSGKMWTYSLCLIPLCLPARAVGVVRAAGGRSMLLSGDGLFQKWRHRSICSRHLAPVCRHGCCHTLLRHLEVPLRPADQSGPDLQMTALTNELTGCCSCAPAFQRTEKQKNCAWDNRLPLLERN